MYICRHLFPEKCVTKNYFMKLNCQHESKDMKTLAKVEMLHLLLQIKTRKVHRTRGQEIGTEISSWFINKIINHN